MTYMHSSSTRTDYNEVFKEILKGLNEMQNLAVNTLDGPVMVIAGPGTGKTQVIAARIGNILLSTDTQPHNILCLTYTDAATIAMRNRLIQFIGPEAYNIQIHTFHAFCNNVIQQNLRYFGGIRELQVINELEEIDIYETIIDDLPNDHLLKRLTGDVYYDRPNFKDLFQTMKKEHWSSEYIISRTDQYIKEMAFDDQYIQKRKSKDREAGGFNKKYEDDLAKFEKLKAAAQLFDVYNGLLERLKRYDFHDMIIWVIEAFRNHPDLLRDYQEMFQYFLVDEYQDTNGAQNELLYLLCDYWDSPNVFVVGDDDQSIFRFQGASMENIVSFKERYGDRLKEIVLTDNYRSTQSILDASRQLIVKGEDRLEAKFPEISKVLTAKSYKDAGALPELVPYFNTEHEKADLLKRLRDAFRKGENMSDYAILYRQHSEVEDIVRALEQMGVPLNLKKKLDILQEPWIGQLLDILRYIVAESDKPYSGEHWLPTIMHFKYFEIHPYDISKISSHCGYDYETRTSKRWKDVLNDDTELKKLGLKNLNSVITFRDNCNHWIKDSLNETVQVLLERVLDFGGVLASLLQEEDKAWKMQLLSTFFEFIKEESRRVRFMKLSDFLQTVEKMIKYNVSLNLQRIYYNPEGVHFVTAHSSKGLEFKHVALINAISKKWEGKRNYNRGFSLPPNIFSKSEENKLEDERRLFYVAMTRAEHSLTISFSEKDRDSKEIQRSRFVAELEDSGNVVDQKEVVALSDGDMIEFGIAQILNKGKAVFGFIDHDVVNKVLEKFKLSVTALNKYLKCPVSFYFENILRVPSARTVHTGFGNAVHSTLELLHNDARKNELRYLSEKGLLDLFDAQMSIFHSHFTKKEFEDRIAFGHQFLPEYYNEYFNEWQKIPDFRMEYNVTNAVCQDVPIKGRLDRVEIRNGQVRVIDYKTGKRGNSTSKLKKPSEKDPLGGDYWRQIVYYKLLLDHDPQSNWKFGSGMFDFVQPESNSNKFKRDEFFVTPEEEKVVTEQIVDAYQNIRSHRFEEGCGEEDCKWCNFVKYNRLESDRPVSDELDPEGVEIPDSMD